MVLILYRRDPRIPLLISEKIQTCVAFSNTSENSSHCSIAIFAASFKKVICIDQWKSHYDTTGKDFASKPEFYDMKMVEDYFTNTVCKIYTNIEKKKMSSMDAVPLFLDNTIDVVYIDALHSYDGVKEDIGLWLPKVKKGGILAGHDYGSKHFPGVKQAIDEIFGKPDKTFKDSSWSKVVK